jgi:hypothetical protein
MRYIQGRRKTPFGKIRNISISIGVLLILFVGGGVAYTWYMSQNDTAPVVSRPTTTLTTGTLKHAKIAANAPASASIQSLSSPIVRGDNASVTVKGNPGSSCVIKVEYNNVPSNDTGLKLTKILDDFGVATWSWTVERTVPDGKWPVTITCTYETKTAIVIGDLVVTQTIAP